MPSTTALRVSTFWLASLFVFTSYARRDGNGTCDVVQWWWWKKWNDHRAALFFVWICMSVWFFPGSALRFSLLRWRWCYASTFLSPFIGILFLAGTLLLSVLWVSLRPLLSFFIGGPGVLWIGKSLQCDGRRFCVSIFTHPSWHGRFYSSFYVSGTRPLFDGFFSLAWDFSLAHVLWFAFLFSSILFVCSSSPISSSSQTWTNGGRCWFTVSILHDIAVSCTDDERARSSSMEFEYDTRRLHESYATYYISIS